MENYDKSRITYIYGLYEVGKENEIRYVGKSDNPKNRLRSHLSTAYKENTHKSCWIKSIIKKSGDIGFKIIEVVSYDNWSKREIYWISNYENLTNTSPGGETGITGKLFEIEYDECKKWINDNYPNVKKIKEFRNIIKELPDFIPKSPNNVFKEYGWISWQNFLNSDYISSKDKNKKMLPYDECKKWLSDNYEKITNWSAIVNDFPDFIPKRPYITYKNSGWCGWINFIGVDLSPKNYIKYKDAKEYVKKLNLNSSNEWFKYWIENHKNIEFPLIPKSPNTVYEEWEGWTFFLGSELKSNDLFKIKPTYRELCEYVKEKMPNIKTQMEYKNYLSKNKINLPKCPNSCYKEEWVSWNLFLNNNNFIKQKKFYSFNECKKIIKNNKIKSNIEYRIWVKTVEGIPKSPENFFKNEWIDWYDWLGKEKR